MMEAGLCHLCSLAQDCIGTRITKKGYKIDGKEV